MLYSSYRATSFRRFIHVHQPQCWTAASSRVRCSRHENVSVKQSGAYWTLAQPARYELEVKKSKFIVFAWPLSSAKQALELIRGTGDPTASHNCFAYKYFDEYRSSDDGEPSGTAGRPILTAIEGEGLEAVCVLVTRYYGGIKLGAGGLVRAYGGAARDCLKAAPRAFVKRRVQLLIYTPFDLLGPVFSLLDKFGCERLSEEYLADGNLQLAVSVEADVADAMVTEVSNATSGRVVPVPQQQTGDSE